MDNTEYTSPIAISYQNTSRFEDEKGNEVDQNEEDEGKWDEEDNSDMRLVEEIPSVRQEVPNLN